MNYIQAQDPEVWSAIEGEMKRQQDGLEMIASENYTSPAVLQTAGSVLTNKYAEGYPGRRYYGGCEYVDAVENIARDRAKQLFGAEFANVQPHSGSQANMAVYLTVLQPGDTVLGLDLAHGGHLTHGSPVSFSGKDYKIISYGVDKESELDLLQRRRALVGKEIRSPAVVRVALQYDAVPGDVLLEGEWPRAHLVELIVLTPLSQGGR